MKDTFQFIYDAAIEKSKHLEDTGEIFELWDDIAGLFSIFNFNEGIYYNEDAKEMREIERMANEKAKFYQPFVN